MPEISRNPFQRNGYGIYDHPISSCHYDGTSTSFQPAEISLSELQDSLGFQGGGVPSASKTPQKSQKNDGFFVDFQLYIYTVDSPWWWFFLDFQWFSIRLSMIPWLYCRLSMTFRTWKKHVDMFYKFFPCAQFVPCSGSELWPVEVFWDSTDLPIGPFFAGTELILMRVPNLTKWGPTVEGPIGLGHVWNESSNFCGSRYWPKYSCFGWESSGRNDIQQDMTW